MKGSVRLVNLLVDKDGKTQRVDVWAVGGMYAPAKLAAGIDFGGSSDWFATPTKGGMRVIAVPEGAAGEAASALATLTSGREGANETSLLTRDGDGRVMAAVNTGADDVARPAAGKGLVLLHAGQLTPFESSLTATVGGRSFMVGEPGGTCAKPVLGGTNYTLHEVPAGRAHFTLHKWPGDCTTPAVFEIDVDVNADKGVRVEVFTRDGAKLETAMMPLSLK
jgi:hypothetical protein